MNWESIINAYPEEKDTILGIKSLREKVERIMAGITIPVIDTPCREMTDLNPFIQVFTPVCIEVWKEEAGTDPSFDMAGVLEAFVTDTQIPPIAEEERQLAEAVLNTTVSCFLHALKEKNKGLIPETWNKGVCPFCGSHARIGIDAEDQRTLACLSCGHTWRFPRLVCPMCGNKDHDQLGYFDAEGIDGVRVYFCRSCTHYIKIVDSRVRIVHDAETEDALTLEMDKLARQEGFTPVP